MPYRIIVDGSVKTVKRDFAEAKRVAQIEALGSGNMVEIEVAEAGNKWTGVELVSANGSEISIAECHSLPDTLFGNHRNPQFLQQLQTPEIFSPAARTASSAKPRAFG